MGRAGAKAAGPGERPQGLIEELPGLGVRLLLNGVEIVAGNASLLERYGASVESSWKDKPGAVVHVARGGAYAGFIVVEDTPREQANTTVNRLRELGVRFVGMLSGDRPENAEKLARELGLDLSLIHISEPTRLLSISYAVFCLKKKNKTPANPHHTTPQKSLLSY